MTVDISPSDPAPPPRHVVPWAGYAFAAAGAILFSSKAIFIKLAYAQGMNTETLLALRMILSLPFYLGIGLFVARDRFRRGVPLPKRGMVLSAAWIGALGYWFASYADFMGLNYITAHFERLILFTYPGFVVIFGALFFRQKITAKAVLAILVSYSGLAVIFLADVKAGGNSIVFGVAWVLLAAIAFAMYQLLAKNEIGRMGPHLFTCVAMAAASAIAIGQFFLTQPANRLLVSGQVLWLGVLLAVGATVLPSFFLNAALHRITAQANAIIGTASPVATIVLAVLFLGETIGVADAVGAALVIAGVGWFTLADRKR